ncbi:PREDICTED: odorant receptor Or1-like [Dufourea novaeangliae]|uniref:odorant receptor Or1-like n=1 Tax=Dufourea novaeangliae TaxID=178035 RepID=UPI0007678D28|nr:PREDICTED: odorant receptor Or1-like [Dufourea novaeangliae]
MDVFALERTKRRNITPNKHLNISLLMIYYMGMWPAQGIILTTEIAYLIVNWGDIAKLAAGATLLMTNTCHACKVIIILCRHERIRCLIDVTRSKLFSRDNIKYERIVTYYTWQGIFHHIAYQSFGTMAVISWGVSPIIDLLSERSKQLPIEGWYPYNVTVSPVFEITSFYQAVAIFICCFNNVAIDTLITGFITIACCQLTLLNRNISSLNPEAEKQSIVSKDDVDVKRSTIETYNRTYDNLKLCIEHSNMIFDFSKEIQSIFGTAIFFQFLVNCIIICLIAFNMAQMKVYILHVLFGMLMYMCCMTYQIFIFCWHGNELYLHSLDVVLASYSNDWWQRTKNFKRAIQIIMTRSQRPLILTAGNIMELSLQNFVRILRMSYSIFTVLQTSTDV